MSVVVAKDLRKSFRTGFLLRSVEAVRGVDLDVKEGEVFGFIGPNGAGKTTTIKMLTGLIFPTSGHATIHGISVTDPRSRARLGFMPESTDFHEYLTGREFLDFHGRLLGLPREVRRERIPKLLERVNMLHAADLRLRRYSKGMRQRVGLAQALIGDADLLILDEPMSGLDPLGRRHVRDLILSLRDEGKTVFVTSHILADAEVICDQVAIILGGRIVHQGYLDELLHEEVEGAELVVEGIDEAIFAELRSSARRAVPQGARFLLDFSQSADAEKAFARALEAGGRVRSFVPKRRSLEDLMVSKMNNKEGVE